ncbi:T6SS effector phospholipase Tle3 domain-containing protein [Pseudomonas alkylphenolica]|uniref:T6SS effector phospholipase Tle3 domain-containing protein n=1 Tax=Pseudomonas alkylphenolica TaxID=237609 RepID=UPI00315CC243
MSKSEPYSVAEKTIRLLPNSHTPIRMEVPADLPGVVIFLHGVNDPGASYESVETGLCQGVNERLDRPDLKAGQYGAQYNAAKAIPTEELRERQKIVLDDPDTYLYQRDTSAPQTRSLMIPFYWGYRAAPDEIKRDENDDPVKLRDQYQDIYNNRLDRHFAKGGGFFANATNNLLEMYGKGFDKLIRHVAQTQLPNTLYMGQAPHRRYFVLAASRLAMLIREIRRVSANETITVMGHSQGTLISLLAQAMLVDRGERCADTLIMVDSPYSVLPKVTPEDHDTLATLINIVSAVTGNKHSRPALAELRELATYGGRSGPRWSARQGTRLDSAQNLTVFSERDNRGKVYLYFCPDDTTVALDDVEGIGTYGVPDSLPDGTAAMSALQALGFYQRLWTKRQRDGAPVLVGKMPGPEYLRAAGEPRYPGGWSMAAAASQAPIPEQQTRLVNAEALNPPHAPQMFGGEAQPGTPTRAGLDRPDDVSQSNALGNPAARFQWIYVHNSPTRVVLEVERERWNRGKDPADQTAALRQTPVSGNAMLKTQDHYRIEREETPREIRARLPHDRKEWDANSYHSAILRSPENHRWVTAMDIAIGQAECLNDPTMREVLVAIADWKLDKNRYEKLTNLPGWSRLGVESQALVTASYLYYRRGKFPATELVSLEPPSLLVRPLNKGAVR